MAQAREVIAEPIKLFQGFTNGSVGPALNAIAEFTEWPIYSRSLSCQTFRVYEGVRNAGIEFVILLGRSAYDLVRRGSANRKFRASTKNPKIAADWLTYCPLVKQLESIQHRYLPVTVSLAGQSLNQLKTKVAISPACFHWSFRS
jgi:hypothetical protein